MKFANPTRGWAYWIIALTMLIAGCNSTMQAEVTPQEIHAIDSECPSPRQTPQPPQAYYLKQNPVAATADNIALGKHLYQRGVQPVSCADCHGISGDGQGTIGKYLQSPPTDFTCKALMETLPDGRLFWVIENGSGLFELAPGHSRETLKRPGRRPNYTFMRGHKNDLTETQIWHVVLYLRSLSK